MSAGEKKSGRDAGKGGPPRPARVPEPELEPLVRAMVGGEREAWSALANAITPRIVAITRAHPSMRGRKLAGREDDVAEVTTSALERITRDDHKNLRRFLEQRDAASGEEGTSFDAWLYGMVDFTIRDHLRKRYGRAPRAEERGKGRPSRRDLNTLAGRLDEEPLDRAFVSTLGATKRVAVAEIFAYVNANFAPLEARALQLFYLEDKSAAEIAELLGLADERTADKLIRKLNARLRYRFAEAEEEPSG